MISGGPIPGSEDPEGPEPWISGGCDMSRVIWRPDEEIEGVPIPGSGDAEGLGSWISGGCD
jgi:hypothetical protein